ncbi:hypothetical protein EmuJ_000694100 [Echinococcus multilocularis]|uniref:DUF4614 domain-containing protein n=1 Tax=Echinococcus multilocularis TaxID=6211 RepID=A0A068YB12_ECHMU|nr:hypothetical protein EmuJ_000694100 [Echinococcus multilocularis]
MYRKSNGRFSNNAVPKNEDVGYESELKAYLKTLSDVKQEKVNDIIRTAATYESATSVGASFLKTNARVSTSKDSKIVKPNLNIDLGDELSEIETLRTKKSPDIQSADQRSPSTYRLSSTPQSPCAIQSGVFDDINEDQKVADSISSATEAESLALRPMPRRRVEKRSSSFKPSVFKGGNSRAPVVYNFEEIMSIQGDDQSQSSSPSLSRSNTSSDSAEHPHVPFTHAKDSESASSDNERTTENVGEYSDDFESSSDEEADKRLTRPPSASESEHKAVRRSVRSGAPSSKIVNSRYVQSSPMHQYSSPAFVKGYAKKSKKRAEIIKNTGESKFHTFQKARENEGRGSSRNVGIMTDVEPRQFPSRTGDCDQKAFVAAVTAAVEHIIAKCPGPRPILPYPLDTKSVIETLTSHSPCLVALDNALQEQLQITRTFLSTQRAMHDALKAALSRCLVPVLEPIDLRLNYTLQTQKEL